MSTLGKIGLALAAPIPDVELLIPALIANPIPGVKFVLGILNRAGKRVSEVQSVLFEKTSWTVADAKKWLKDQGFKVPTVDDAKNFFRFRQTSPTKYKEMRTIEAGRHLNPRPIVVVHTGTGVKVGDFDTREEAQKWIDGLGVTPSYRDRFYRIKTAEEWWAGHPSNRSRRNPESIPESLTGHLALTSDPFFQQQPPEIQAAMMTGMDLAERVKGNPVSDEHLRNRLRLKQDFLIMLAADMGGFLESFRITDHAGAPTLSQIRQYVYPEWEHAVDAQIRALAKSHSPKIGVPDFDALARKGNPAYGQVKGRDWMQESYESASNDARKRASELRKLGYRVAVESMGPQVTPVGTVRMTMVSIAPGKTGDEYLENVPETKVVRLNPHRYGYRKSSSGHYEIVDTGTGEIVRTVKTKSAALQVTASMNAKAKRNPNGDDAAALSEKFHGRPAETVTTLTEDMVERVDFMEVGDLVELKVQTPSGYDVVLQFPPKGKATVKLCASPDGKQLYFRGGDQKVPLDEIHMGAEKWKRDRMVLGELRSTVYRAEKKFDKFKTHDYEHKNSEISKKYPVLIYDTLNDQLEVAGGTGFITWRGMED